MFGVLDSVLIVCLKISNRGLAAVMGFQFAVWVVQVNSKPGEVAKNEIQEGEERRK